MFYLRENLEDLSSINPLCEWLKRIKASLVEHHLLDVHDTDRGIYIDISRLTSHSPRTEKMSEWMDIYLQSKPDE